MSMADRLRRIAMISSRHIFFKRNDDGVPFKYRAGSHI
jgi:hypothetical protein